MRFRTYAGARPGISQIMQAIAAPGGNAYNDTMRDLSMVDANRSLAAERQGQARLHDQQHQARGSIGGALQDVPLPEGLTPDLAAALFVGSENPNFRDYTQGIRDMGGTSGQRAAMAAAEGGDVPKLNRIVSALSETPYEPFKLSETGRLDSATGDVQYTPGHQALARERDAGAAENYAQAREADAGAYAKRFSNLPAGASLVDLLPGAQGQPQSPITGALAGIGPEGAPQSAEPPMAPGPQIVTTAPGKPGGTNVTVNSQQEGSFSKELGKQMAQRYDEIESGAIQANNMTNRLDRLGTLLDQVNTGRFAGGVLALKQAARGVGIDLESLGVTDDVGPAEAAKALSNELALQLRSPAGGAGMPGAMSDKDREFLVSMVPGLMNSPEGRRAMIETSKKLNQRSVDVAKMARAYMAENGQLDQGFFTALQMWSEENPLFEAPTVYQHPELGTITEEDIAETMRANSMSREQVMQQLGLQ